jgi:hypothetical protein
MRRRIATLGAASVLVFAAGCGGTATTGTTSNGSTATAGVAAPGGAPNLSTLATKLGVSTSKLQAAMDAVRPQQGSTPSSPDDMASVLAKKLGLSTAKVRAALDATRPQGGTPPQDAPSGQTSSS